MVRDMTQGNVTRHLLTYAVPLMFANLLQQLYQTVDSIIVGQYNGKEALAAIGAAGPIMNILIFLIVGLSLGASILMSEYFGAKDYKALKTELAAVLIELQRIETGKGVDEELLNVIELIAVILGGMKGDGENGK